MPAFAAFGWLLLGGVLFLVPLYNALYDSYYRRGPWTIAFLLASAYCILKAGLVA
jgi:hypothetical protein